MKIPLFKLAWIGGLGVYVLFMLYLIWKGGGLHIGGSPYEILYLYVPLGLFGLIGLGLSLRDGALLHPASLLTVTGVMGSLLAFFLDRTGILMNYDRWVRTMPERPSSSPCQVSSAVKPTGVSAPIPVITTRGRSCLPATLSCIDNSPLVVMTLPIAL